jgi:hypothetical protein
VSARVWTREKLNEVHPLPDPDGWEWIPDPGVRGGWFAASGDGRVVCVLMDGRIRFGNMDDVPDSVALAVLHMARGHDSLESMAIEVDRIAERTRPARQLFRKIAEMLRRGTVDP